MYPRIFSHGIRSEESFELRQAFIRKLIDRNSPIRNPRRYGFNSLSGYYWIDQFTGNLMLNDGGLHPPFNYQEVSPQLFIETICTFIDNNKLTIDCEWWKTLQVGDTVKIGCRTGRSEDYPYAFSDVMASWHGKEFIIEEIKPCTSYYSDRRFYNGDDHKYYLSDHRYVWHSSMFVPEIVSTIKINLTELNITKLFK